MIRPISEAELTSGERLSAFFNQWIGICTETGAFLRRSNGSSAAGVRFLLILPNKSPADRGGLLKPYEWSYPHGRKFISAWSDDEAIDLANKKLAKMIIKLSEAQR